MAVAFKDPGEIPQMTTPKHIFIMQPGNGFLDFVSFVGSEPACSGTCLLVIACAKGIGRGCPRKTDTNILCPFFVEPPKQGGLIETRHVIVGV